MDKEKLKLEKQMLLSRKEELERELNLVEHQLTNIDRLEKPYVAVISSYSGGSSARFGSEKAARNKMNEYFSKKYFRNGLTYGVYLYKWNEDLTKTLLEVKPKATKDFYPLGFKKGE